MDGRRLREETRAEHEATERRLPLMEPGLTRASYVEVLRGLYPIVQSWEAWAEGAAPRELLPLLAVRRRSALLRRDLVHFGDADLEGAPVTPDWNAVVFGHLKQASNEEKAAAFLGGMYVLEGSALGGQLIARHVEEVLALDPSHGDAYFRGHEGRTGGLWRELMERVKLIPDECAEVTVTVAKRTFVAFGNALDQTLAAQGKPVPTKKMTSAVPQASYSR